MGQGIPPPARHAVGKRATTEPAVRNSGAAAPAPSAGSTGMILAVDPETGMLAMPESQLHRALTIPELQALARAEAEGLVTIQNADGSETLNHAGRFADHSIVRVGPDRKLIFECVQGEGQFEHALRGPLPATSAVEVK